MTGATQNTPRNADDGLKLLDEINQRLASLAEESVPRAAPSKRDVTEEALLSARVDMVEMDALLDGISEATIQIGSMQRIKEIRWTSASSGRRPPRRDWPHAHQSQASLVQMAVL